MANQELLELSQQIAKYAIERNFSEGKAATLAIVTLALKNINTGVSVADASPTQATSLIRMAQTSFQLLFDRKFFPEDLGKITFTANNPRLPEPIKIHFMRQGFDTLSDLEKQKYQTWDNVQFGKYIQEQFS